MDDESFDNCFSGGFETVPTFELIRSPDIESELRFVIPADGYWKLLPLVPTCQ